MTDKYEAGPCQHEHACREVKAQEYELLAKSLRSGMNFSTACVETKAWCHDCGVLILGKSVPV